MQDFIKSINQEEIQTMELELRASIDRFSGKFKEVSEEDINRIPFAGSWTAAQVMEHIYKSIDGMCKLMQGPVEPSLRDPKMNVDSLKKLLLNFDVKLESPEFVRPADIIYDKDRLFSLLKKTESEFLELLNAFDMTKTCSGFEFPKMGFLTRFELCAFILYHVQRHTHQLENIILSL